MHGWSQMALGLEEGEGNNVVKTSMYATSLGIWTL